MSEKIPFQYSVLRYRHDPITQESLNFGVLIFAPLARYIGVRVNTRYRRLSEAFTSFSPDLYKLVINSIESKVRKLQGEWEKKDLFSTLPLSIEEVRSIVFFNDETSFGWGSIGEGHALDLDLQLDQLFYRLVLQYADRQQPESRDDAQVWRSFTPALASHNLLTLLQPAKIVTATYSETFPNAWKNDRWHPLTPLSFDLVEQDSIYEKAQRWIGRTKVLQQSEQLGTINFLVGAPRRTSLKYAYEGALHDLAIFLSDRVRIVREDDSEEFSESLAREIRAHSEKRDAETA